MPGVRMESAVIRVGVVGSRRRNEQVDYDTCKAAIEQIMEEHPDEDIILVSGGCKQGADSFVWKLCSELDLQRPVEHHPQYEKGSPYYIVVKALKARNTLIAQDCDILVALPAADRTGGTEDTITKAETFATEVRLV